MFSTQVVDRSTPRKVSFRTMQPGQIGRITRCGLTNYIGELVLRGFDVVASLTTPGRNTGPRAPILT